MLLEDQLAETREAFKNAHEAGNKEAAQALAQRVFELETQISELKKAEQESLESQSSYRNPAVAGGAGAVVGAATNPIRGAIHDVITPTPAPKVAAPIEPTFGGQGGENWTKALTGVDVPGAQMNKPSLDIGQRMAATVGRGGELAGGSITPGGIMLGPELGAKPVAPAPVTPIQKITQGSKSLLKDFVADHQPSRPMDIVKGGTRGAVTGAALADVPQQVAQGNYGTAAADVGLAGGNILHGLAGSPKKKALGALLGLGSGIVRAGQGVSELFPTEQKAEGGLVYMADGGQPENAPYVGYPQINRHRQIGYGSGYLDRLAESIDPIGISSVNAAPSLLAETPNQQSYREGREAAEPLANASEMAQMLMFGKALLKPAVKYTAPKAMKLIDLIRNANVTPGYAAGGTVLKKLHEVLTPHEGKTLLATLADRTKATGGFQGGPGFINLNPDYTWAVDAPNVAKKHMEAVERFGGPNRTLMVPMLMSKEAHKSNRPVFEQIYGDVSNRIKTGELTPDQIAAINRRIAIEKKADLSKNPGIESPDFLEFANAFNRRGAIADILGLKKLGATNLQKHLDETIDPALREAPTGAIGPQLFTMTGYEHAPGLHGGYDIGFRGEKGADQFIPAEREFVFRDLEKQAMEQMGRPMTDYNYRHVFKEHGGIPNQLIDEKLLRGLQELGHKEGGLVALKKKK